MQLQGIEGLRGRRALELNLQLSDQKQCETDERDGVRIQSDQRKIHRWSYGRQNRSTTVGIVVLKKPMNVSRPSEHPSVRGGNVKTFR